MGYRRLFVLFTLALVAMVPLGRGARAAESFSPAQTEAIEQILHNYLIQHPEVILEAVDTLDKKRKAAEESRIKAAIAAHRPALEASAGALTLGSAKPDLTLIEFFDYRCPYCKQMVPGIAALLKSDPKLRVIMRELPVLGPDSLLASRAALASRAQGKYAPFHDALMAARGSFTEASILQTAAEVGIDTARLKKDMSDPKIEAELRVNHALAETLGITGTPALIVGDHLLPGAVPIDQLQSLIGEARAEGCQTC